MRCFVSDVWGGRASNKHITLSSKLLDSLEPGDAVLTDRGFLIDDYLKVKLITLICPAFRGPNRAQLSAEEVHDTGRIAETRIHVERAIREINY